MSRRRRRLHKPVRFPGTLLSMCPVIFGRPLPPPPPELWTAGRGGPAFAATLAVWNRWQWRRFPVARSVGALGGAWPLGARASRIRARARDFRARARDFREVKASAKISRRSLFAPTK